MDKNLFDKAIDELKKRRLKAREVMKARFGHTTPYGMVKMTDKERVDNYLSLKEEVKADLRNDPEWLKDEEEVFNIMRRKGYGF